METSVAPQAPAEAAVVPPTAPAGEPNANLPQEPKDRMDVLKEAIADFEAKKEKQLTPAKDVQPKPEDTEDFKEPNQEEANKETPEEGESTEKVTLNGKEVPIADLFEKSEFQIPYKGEMRTLTGEEVLNLAGRAYHASNQMTAAKEAIQKTQEVIREIEQSQESKVREGVASQLQSLLQLVSEGVNPATNQQFESADEQARAVDLVKRMKGASQESPKESLSKEDLQKLVEERVEKKLLEQEEKAREKQALSQTVTTARETLRKVTTPYMQSFLKSDGKTLNERMFKSYLSDVQSEATTSWEVAGKPKDVGKFIEKAAKSVFGEYRESLNVKTEVKPKAAPVASIKPTTSAGIPASSGKMPPGLSYSESVAWRKAQAGIR